MQLTGLESILSRSHYKTERKNKYSFGKSQRFAQTKSKYTIDYFEVHSARQTRTCSFGYGNKCFFVPPPNNPGATKYTMPLEKKVGLSFGASRQKLHAGDYLNKTILEKSPPSNNYNPHFDSISKFANSSKFSIRKKNASDSFLKSNLSSLNPEPSKYDVNLEKEGRVTISNFKTPKKSSFQKSARFIDNLENSLIGPAKYQIKEDSNSRNHSSKKSIFSKAAKMTFTMEAMKTGKNKSPGPVYYIP